MSVKPFDIVFIRDLELMMSIGIHDHEKSAEQRVVINIELHTPARDDHDENIKNAVCYETVTNKIITLTRDKHFNLVETLANEIATICLKEQSVERVMIKIEKPDIIDNAGAVGIQITRTK